MLVDTEYFILLKIVKVFQNKELVFYRRVIEERTKRKKVRGNIVSCVIEVLRKSEGI